MVRGSKKENHDPYLIRSPRRLAVSSSQCFCRLIASDFVPLTLSPAPPVLTAAPKAGERLGISCGNPCGVTYIPRFEASLEAQRLPEVPSLEGTALTPPDSPATFMSAAPTKDTSRNERLSISYSHKAEHVLRGQLGDRALRKCEGLTKAFADCARDQGLMVVFNCRGHNNSMNECLRHWNSDEKFEEFKRERAREIIKK